MANPEWKLQNIPGSYGCPDVRLPVTIRDKSITLRFEPPENVIDCSLEGADNRIYFRILRDSVGQIQFQGRSYDDDTSTTSFTDKMFAYVTTDTTFYPISLHRENTEYCVVTDYLYSRGDGY